MTWYEMCKLHMQRKLCRPVHNIQKRANSVRQSKQKSELAYTSNYTLIDIPPQAQIGLQTTTIIPKLKTALLLMLSLLPVSLLPLSQLLRLLVLLLSLTLQI